MQLSNRKSKIVFELLHNDNYITGQYLANATGVTSRTIRGDIKELNDELIDTELSIYSESSRGYYIPKGQRDQWFKIAGDRIDYFIPILPEGRIEHILKQLILHPKGISTDDISQQLYVSKSTLDRDIIKIANMLEEKGLALDKKTGSTISVSGDERFIREMYQEAFLNAVKLHTIDKNFADIELNNIFEKAYDIVFEIAGQSDINLSGDEFDAFAVFLCVMLFRNHNGFVITDYKKRSLQLGERTNNILQIINDKERLDSCEEAYAADWIQKVITKNNKVEDIYVTHQLIKEGIEQVKKTFNCHLRDEINGKLFNIFSEYHIKTNEQYLQDVKKEYPSALEMTFSLVNYIKRRTDIDISDYILEKIIMLFVCEMENDMMSKELKEKDVIIICQAGEFVINLIKTRIKRYFPSFNILGTFPLYKVEKAFELQPELIISTVMIENSDVPLIVINPLFKDYDILKINTLIRQLEHKESVGYEFLNLFREELFIKDIEATDKYEAIKVLFDVFKTNGYAQDNFYQAVVERENISSTAIGSMVAVPHAVGNDSGENVIAVGILKNPIDWNGDKVQLVFEINIKNAADGNVQQIFSSFYNLVSSNRKIERLIKSKNYYEFLKTINQ